MYYSENDIDEIMKKYNIVDEISKYVTLTMIGSMYFGKCPFHNDESKSFMVNPKKQVYYCFGCGHGGNLINFLMDYHKIPFTKAIHLLDKKIETKNTQMLKDKEKIIAINTLTTELYANEFENNAIGKKYALKRKLSDETIKKFKIGFSYDKGDVLYKKLKEAGFTNAEIKKAGVVGFYEKNKTLDRFYERMIFPIQNYQGEIIGFGGRAMNEKKSKENGMAKYLNSPETIVFDKSNHLFGLNFAIESKEEYFIVCEGYMDVISLHQAGFTSAIASLGTALTQEQANLMNRFKKKVYLAYDSDGPGTKAAARAAEILSKLNMEIYFIDMNPYKDPDEFIKNLGSEEYKKRILNSLNYEEWNFKTSVIQDDLEKLNN